MKQKYNIKSINSNDYMKNEWEIEFDPSKVKESKNKIKKKEEPLKGVCLIKNLIYIYTSL